MTKEITDGNSFCIVLKNRAKDELIGYVSFRLQDNVVNIEETYLECYVYELMIQNAYQRKGYGKFLMELCELVASSRECDYIELTVFTANIAGIKFYRKQMQFSFDVNELEQYKHDYRIL